MRRSWLVVFRNPNGITVDRHRGWCGSAEAAMQDADWLRGIAPGEEVVVIDPNGDDYET